MSNPLEEEFREACAQVAPGLYKNWKGHLVLVIGVGMHSETLEPQVEYYELTDRTGTVFPNPIKWHRPLSYFVEQIEQDGYQGPRFAKVNERMYRTVRVYQ